MTINHVSEAVIRRLPGYYRHLKELEAEGIKQISSQELGARMKQTPSQIRQDINNFGGFGRQGFGYSVTHLRECIGEIMGLDERHNMIIIGAGSLGNAVVRYPTFRREGFLVKAMFDIDEKKVGQTICDIPVLHMDELEKYVAENPVDIAVLTLPAEEAQKTMERLYQCGVTAVWNFAPVDLEHDRNAVVMNVHLSDSLKVLSYKMAHRNGYVRD